MPGTFTYTKSTNILVVTEGTSGSPANFASMLAADRAGSVELLAAWTPDSNTKAVTYQITPAEILALLISFVVASKTTEADYIFITGTDAWTNAQTESIDVSAGNGTYVSTKRFRTITNISCSDNAAGGGTVWADGTVQITQPQWGVILCISASGQYTMSCHVEIGDGSTSTYLLSNNEHIYFNNSCNLTVKANATLALGSIDSTNYGFNGSVISYYPTATRSIVDAGGYLLLYASKVKCRRNNRGIDIYGEVILRNSIFEGSMTTTSEGSLNTYENSVLDFYDSLVTFFNHLCFQGMTPVIIRSVFSNLYDGIFTFIESTVRGANLGVSTNLSIVNYAVPAANFYIVDPVAEIITSSVYCYLVDSYVYQIYTFNLMVADSQGNPLENASVSCYDSVDTVVFSGILTDVNGIIAEQQITYRWWKGIGSNLTVFTPHKFTISKAGYQTLVIDNITIDSKINWHLELQPLDEPPAPWEV